jgi:predicted O-methyltransferase YrrM
VKRALNLAEQMGSRYVCSTEAGRLLQLLASQFDSGVVGELGAGCGVTAAWMISALSPGTSFFTVEEDAVSAAAVRILFDSMLNVRIVHGDWREFLRNWRFGLLHAGPASAREKDPEILVGSLRRGGLLVMDGITPIDHIPLEMRDRPDPIREFWLNDARLIATELLVSSNEAVILATLKR